MEGLEKSIAEADDQRTVCLSHSDVLAKLIQQK